MVDLELLIEQAPSELAGILAAAVRQPSISIGTIGFVGLGVPDQHQ